MVLTHSQPETRNSRGLSPVIGVVLLLAIVVILAGIIGTFVFGLSDSVTTTTPNANFDFEYDSEGSDTITIRHTGGDDLDQSSVTIRGADACSWEPDSPIRAGSTCQTEAHDDRISVVWEGEERSVVLSSYDVPTTD